METRKVAKAQQYSIEIRKRYQNHATSKIKNKNTNQNHRKRKLKIEVILRIWSVFFGWELFFQRFCKGLLFLWILSGFAAGNYFFKDFARYCYVCGFCQVFV